MKINSLPKFTFIDEQGQGTDLELSKSGPEIARRASLMQGLADAGSVVGLLHKSGPELVLDWLGAVAAGYKPLVMQYPTKKQSFQYWSESVANTVAVATVKLMLVDEHCASLLEKSSTPTLRTQADSNTASKKSTSKTLKELNDFSIIQLSSGTTGYRKAMEFTSENLLTHATDYNATLKLSPSKDVIVSWLPLYHDMGYVACFVMPLLLGIPVVMMDPMTWIANPALLTDTIIKYSGTICYMPNFGFEVMTKTQAKPTPSMKRWVSCSEPVSADTCRKFAAHMAIPEEIISPCYAMAENIFAVAIGSGIHTLKIDATDVISCGSAIQGVQLKVVDGEIFAKSPTSLRNYIGTDDIRDDEGYYPTGDLGTIDSGRVYITGRKGDLLIQAGKKFMLSDIDLVVNRLDPSIKGRSAAIQLQDSRLGTQKACVLVEDQNFFEKTSGAELASGIKDILGVEQVDVRFVPPRFLTKTSSGKFNRKKCAEHWLKVEESRSSATSTQKKDVETELKRTFPSVNWEAPCFEVLDSLSITVLRLILSDSNIKYQKEWSLKQYVEVAKQEQTSSAESTDQEIRIVSLIDRGVIGSLRENHISKLGKAMGCRVTLEHVCLPPTPIVLSDLIFQEYFLPRVNSDEYSMVSATLNKLRNASLILIDDNSEMFFPPAQVYGVLSHNLERDPRVDLVSTRWQRYPEKHNKLPLTLVSGCDIPYTQYDITHQKLSKYLETPVLRVAQLPGTEDFTQSWEYRVTKGIDRNRGDKMVEPFDFVDHIAKRLKSLGSSVRKFPATNRDILDVVDLAHYCSHYVNKDSVDKILDSYSRFCIVGKTSSAPYVAKKIESMGKEVIYAPSFAPEVLEPLKSKFDCALSVGSMGKYEVTVPLVAVMGTGTGYSTINIDDDEIEALRFSHHSMEAPESGRDWFVDFESNRAETMEQFLKIRDANRIRMEQVKAKRNARTKGKGKAKAKPKVDNFLWVNTPNASGKSST